MFLKKDAPAWLSAVQLGHMVAAVFITVGIKYASSFESWFGIALLIGFQLLGTYLHGRHA